jgi:hypothetical protein
VSLAYYTRTRLGVWIRSRLDLSTGEIVLQHQPKVSFSMGATLVMDLNGTTREEFYSPHSDALGCGWSEGASLSLDTAQFGELGGALGVVEGVARHAACLLANGYGEDEEEVMGWFASLVDLDFVEGSIKYRVFKSCKPLLFLEYGDITLECPPGEAECVDCTMTIDQDPITVRIDERPELWVLSATSPVVNHDRR